MEDNYHTQCGEENTTITMMLSVKSGLMWIQDFQYCVWLERRFSSYVFTSFVYLFKIWGKYIKYDEDWFVIINDVYQSVLWWVKCLFFVGEFVILIGMGNQIGIIHKLKHIFLWFSIERLFFGPRVCPIEILTGFQPFSIKIWPIFDVWRVLVFIGHLINFLVTFWSLNKLPTQITFMEEKLRYLLFCRSFSDCQFSDKYVSSNIWSSSFN